MNRPDIYKRMDSYNNLLTKFLIDFSKTELIKLEKQINDDLEIFDSVLYISEMLLLYRSIIQEKLYSTKPKKIDIQLFLHLKDSLVEKDKKLIIYYLYTGSFIRGNYDINLEDIILESKQYTNDPLFFEMKLDNINNQTI